MLLEPPIDSRLEKMRLTHLESSFTTSLRISAPSTR